MSGSILVAVSYAFLVVFAVAFVVRTVRLARLPVHLRWELSPVPHERSKGRYGGSYFEEYEWWTKPREKSLLSELRYMLAEIVLLKAVREHNRPLWWFSFPFHLGVYLVGGTAVLLLVAAAGDVAGVTGASGAAVHGVLTVTAGAGCALGVVGTLGLLARRLFDPKLRDYTSPATLLHLLLLLALFATGAVAVVGTPYAAGMTGYLAALLTARGAALPGPLAVHVVVALVFLAVLPFSRMMHFVAKFFTYHQVRWDDEPLQPGSRMEREIESLLAQPVTWAAPHIGADGTKNWVDLATEETSR